MKIILRNKSKDELLEFVKYTETESCSGKRDFWDMYYNDTKRWFKVVSSTGQVEVENGSKYKLT